jgi:biopolymer transport protein ExbD
MTTWLIRPIGDPTTRRLSAPQEVLDGLRDGDWEPSDEVLGPGETLWQPIEDHPLFADAVAEMGPPPPEHPDETKLDMNPLIDVALVLLVFFILTATVSTLRRTIDVPRPQTDDATVLPKIQDMKDQVFNVTVNMDGDNPVVAIEKRPIVFDRLEQELKDVVKNTGKKDMYLVAADDVTWDVYVQIQGAATEAGVRKIHMPRKK